MTPEQLTAITDTVIPVVIHRQGAIRFANKAALELVGAADAGQVVGRNVTGFIDTLYRPGAAIRLRRLEEGKPLLLKHLEAKFVRLDGTKFRAVAEPFIVEHEGSRSVLTMLLDGVGSRAHPEEFERLSGMFQSAP